jgi:hypothetical protein
LRYGLGSKDEVTLVSPDVLSRVKRTVDAIAGFPGLTPAQVEALLEAINPIWS